MTHRHLRRLRPPVRASLLAATAAAGLASGPALACPLGAHDGPRAHLLHGLMQRRDHDARRSTWAQAQGAQAQGAQAQGAQAQGAQAQGARVQEGQTQGAQGQAAAPPARPARSEIGLYARDLPRGAAASGDETRPPLDDALGRLSWPVSANPQAQAYFDQGHRLGWAFNHAEAARAFRAAQALDPGCAPCFWGEAWVLGPHINYPMEADANARALLVLAEARRLAPGATGMQAALIEALSHRHAPDPGADRKRLDRAYADAMEAVQARFPHDANVALLTADALMNLSPWDYWADDGRTPKGATGRMVELIEGVLGDRPLGPLVAAPDHPGAIHLYIHVVEASDRPERAAPHAARLEALAPGAGHLVHMPSHIWYRLGRWRESLDANLRAATVDEALLRAGGASLLYSEGYYAHNVHFVMVSALMGGDGGTAVAAAEKLAGFVSGRAKREVPWTQPIAAAPYQAHAHFSAPEAVLALPVPEAGFPFVRAAWHYARGVALARLGRADAARAEAAAITDLGRTPEIAALPDAGVPGPDVLAIAARVVEGRAAQAEGEHGRAAALFGAAAELQDRLPYMEPPFWYYPVHQSLGAALLSQGKMAEAEAAFRAALERAPGNGWAAAGLLHVAEARGDAEVAERARGLLRRSWFGPDVPGLDRL